MSDSAFDRLFSAKGSRRQKHEEATPKGASPKAAASNAAARKEASPEEVSQKEIAESKGDASASWKERLMRQRLSGFKNPYKEPQFHLHHKEAGTPHPTQSQGWLGRIFSSEEKQPGTVESLSQDALHGKNKAPGVDHTLTHDMASDRKPQKSHDEKTQSPSAAQESPQGKQGNRSWISGLFGKREKAKIPETNASEHAQEEPRTEKTPDENLLEEAPRPPVKVKRESTKGKREAARYRAGAKNRQRKALEEPPQPSTAHQSVAAKEMGNRQEDEEPPQQGKVLESQPKKEAKSRSSGLFRSSHASSSDATEANNAFPEKSKEIKGPPLKSTAENERVKEASAPDKPAQAPKSGSDATEAPHGFNPIGELKSKMDGILKRRTTTAGFLHKAKRSEHAALLKKSMGSAIGKIDAWLMEKKAAILGNKIIHKLQNWTPKQESQIDVGKIFRRQVEKGRIKPTASERKRRLVDQMEKAGLELEPAKIPKAIIVAASGLNAIIMIVWLIFLIRKEDAWTHILFVLFLIWTLGYFLSWVFSWICFLAYLDIRKFNRKLNIEDVLPDYLQLTSANIRAGMPIDRALWFAVRPKFGVLAKEIEDVAKRTLSGEDLNKALIDFSKKYDSPTLQRSISLLIEGTEAGGDVGELLNKIAQNLNELKAMKREMGANVMTYVIFITFASIVAAPILFALSEQLLKIVQDISTGVAASGGTPKGGVLTINLGTDNIKASDFKAFIFSSLAISSIFSAIIVTTIRKGDVKEGLHYIPIFIAVAVGIFLVASYIMGLAFAGFSPSG